MIPRYSARGLGAALLGVVATVMAGLTWEALTPREDWYDGSTRVWPLRFRPTFGVLYRVDKLQHLLAAAGLSIGLFIAIGAARPTMTTRRRMIVAICSVQLWCTVIEIIQGVLPYRNFEFLDILANLSGGVVAATGIAIGLASRRRKDP